jgi:hypothetical protein
LRRHVRDFLNKGLTVSFKMTHVDENQNWENLPSKEQMKNGFKGLIDSRAKAVNLFTATTGLRKLRISSFLESQVDLKTHAVIPKHFTRKKRSGITFYNFETVFWFEKYLNKRKDNSENFFVISKRKCSRYGKRPLEVQVLTFPLKFFVHGSILKWENWVFQIVM